MPEKLDFDLKKIKSLLWPSSDGEASHGETPYASPIIFISEKLKQVCQVVDEICEIIEPLKKEHDKKVAINEYLDKLWGSIGSQMMETNTIVNKRDKE